MNDNFDPITPFEGYIKAKLESIEKRLDQLPCGESFSRISKCENKVANMEGRAAIFGTVMGFLSGLFGKWVLGR